VQQGCHPQLTVLKNHLQHHFLGTTEGSLKFLSSLRFLLPASEAFQMSKHVAAQISNL
jgi:hypothetical protein